METKRKAVTWTELENSYRQRTGKQTLPLMQRLLDWAEEQEDLYEISKDGVVYPRKSNEQES